MSNKQSPVPKSPGPKSPGPKSPGPATQLSSSRPISGRVSQKTASPPRNASPKSRQSKSPGTKPTSAKRLTGSAKQTEKIEEQKVPSVAGDESENHAEISLEMDLIKETPVEPEEPVVIL